MQAVTGVEGSFEQFLADKASALEQPIAANLELSPVCNMDCSMCYVRMDMKEILRLGGLPDYHMWIKLGRDMREMGILFLLITGGEPLLYPHFREVYRYYYELGFIMTINTNGTMIDEEWADFFAAYPPRRLNITIYGTDDSTYQKLCGNHKGFEQLCRGISLIRERGIPMRMNCSLTRYNYEQWAEMRTIAREWEVALESAYYMMPPGRKITSNRIGQVTNGIEEDSNEKRLRARHNESRMSPQLAAEMAFRILTCDMNEEEKAKYIQEKVSGVENWTADKSYRLGYRCRAGNSSFWVKWDGSMTACGMMGDREFNVRERSLEELWEEVKERTKKTRLCERCTNCRLRPVCPSCASAEYTENGGFGKEPEYLCQFAEAFYRVLKKEAAVHEEIL